MKLKAACSAAFFFLNNSSYAHFCCNRRDLSDFRIMQFIEQLPVWDVF